MQVSQVTLMAVKVFPLILVQGLVWWGDGGEGHIRCPLIVCGILWEVCESAGGELHACGVFVGVEGRIPKESVLQLHEGARGL